MSSVPAFVQLEAMADRETRHSVIGFSATERWWNCPGSVALIATLDPATRSHTSEFAREGIIAHLVAAVRLEHGVWPSGTPLEMRQFLELYVEAIRERLPRDRFAESRFLIEHKFHLASIHRNAWGTTDVAIADASLRIARAIDLKYGAGQPVEVRTPAGPNKQLMGYLLGLVMELPWAPEALELVIVQPRCEHGDGPVRSTWVSIGELMDFASNLEVRTAATDDPTAPRVAGPWCGKTYCPAAHVCDAVQELAQREAVLAFAPVPDYDPARLARALEFIETVRAWAGPVHSFATAEALAGREIPGWGLKATRPSKHWIDEERTATTLMLDFDLTDEQVFARKIRSPAQIEAAVSKDRRKQVAELYHKESSGVKLVQLKDAREALRLERPEDQFDAIENDKEGEWI